MNLPPEPASSLPDHTREKRIAGLVLLGMAVAVILIPSSAMVRTIFSLVSALVLVTWLDYAALERGKPIRMWMKVVIVIGGMFLAQVYLRIVGLVLMQIIGR